MSANTHGRKGRPWRTLRLQILARDPYCQIRGPRCTYWSTQVDHRLPLSQYPELAHDPDNLQGACAACNARGGAQLTNNKRYGTPTTHYRPRQPQPSQDWYGTGPELL